MDGEVKKSAGVSHYLITDRDFLIWLHKQLEVTHDVRAYDMSMYRLRAIIAAMDADQITTNEDGKARGSLDELLLSLNLTPVYSTIQHDRVGNLTKEGK